MCCIDGARLDRSIAILLLGCAKIISRNIGGTSGSIWRAAFRSAGKSISGKEMLTSVDVMTMFRAAADAIMDRGGANLGDKTLLDALVPGADAFEQTIADLQVLRSQQVNTSSFE